MVSIKWCVRRKHFGVSGVGMGGGWGWWPGQFERENRGRGRNWYRSKEFSGVPKSAVCRFRKSLFYFLL